MNPDKPAGIAENAVAVDDEGYLVEPGDWDEKVAAELARQEGIVLSGDHWAVIRFVRAYYDDHQIIPDARHVIKHLAGYRADRSTGRNDLFRLFPYGYAKQACRIAGMRRPRAWSTG